MKILELTRQDHDKMGSDLEAFLDEDAHFDDKSSRENLKAIIDFQDSDGSFKLLDSYDITGSGERDLRHMLTCISSAILMKAYLSRKCNEAELIKGLKASSIGGLSELKGQIEALNIFMRGGLREFIDLYPELCPEFTGMIRQIIYDFSKRESEGRFCDSEGEDYESRIKAINEYFSTRRVFVYGTLMRGESNHHYLEGSDFISKAVIDGYEMYDVGWYPAIVHGNGRIIGEIYQVPEEDMPSIDMLEGEGDLYLKECVMADSNFAFVYVYLRDVSDLERIASWKKHVWYVSYGSNMLFERFMRYIKGGPFRGSNYREPCKDQSDPVEIRTVEIPYDMYFGNYSSWGGGVSFLDTGKEGHSIGVAYLISREQFDHVAAEENGGRYPDGFGEWYEDIIDLGTMDGFEVKTITNNIVRDYNEPCKDYLETLTGGIRENWLDMDDKEIEDYLMGCIR